MKLREEVKEKWVARLRSGEVEQGKGKLRTVGGERCCLGVLCDIAADEGVGSWVFKAESSDDDDPYDFEPEWQFRTANPLFGSEDWRGANAVDLDSNTLPPAVAIWAGLLVDPTDSIARSRAGSGQYRAPALLTSSESLIDDNDDHGKTFAEIADIIEEQF